MFRCELCDEFLNVFQLSHLCSTCYKIRTIVKCYSCADILANLEEHFLVSKDKKNMIEEQDKQFHKDEEKRLENEFKKQMNILPKTELKPKVELPKIIEEEETNDKKDYDKPNLRNKNKKVNVVVNK